METPDGEAHPHPFDPAAVAAAQAVAVSADEAHELAELLGVIGDPVRSRILSALAAAGELCVGDTAIALSVSEDAASYGLRVLRTAGLIERRREGRLIYHRLRDSGARAALVAALHDLRELATARSGPDVENDEE
ncbi:MAG: metalloregulator ArsR/SmtB family transcription factor [Actinomycetota bacterium]|nr:metalloregulator ArsR/SmtB family transcription factor [Actinomycetota bacterium]